jgi:hypothetical protein
MKHSKLLRSALAAFVVACTAMLYVTPVSSAPPPAHGVKATPIGNPTWKPVDFHLFSAPIGTAQTGYAEFADTALALLPPPNHVFVDGLFVGPGAPHAPPYDTEFANGVANLGYHEGVHFATSEFSGGSAVYLVWMTVPAPGTIGSSPDFVSGPIIPNALFPIHGIGTDEHDGKPFSFVGEAVVPPLDDAIAARFAGLDGHSHFPMYWADNADFGPAGAKLAGSYRYVIDMTDQTGNGWHVEAHFTIGP